MTEFRVYIKLEESTCVKNWWTLINLNILIAHSHMIS